MKNVVVALLVLALLLFSSSALAQEKGDWEFKLGYDFGGDVEIGPHDSDIDSGFSLTGEYKMRYSDMWQFGGGITYQLQRGIEEFNPEYPDAEFNFTPIYAIAEYHMMESPAYFFGHLGYNMFGGNDDFEDGISDPSGGLYYALGAGMDFGENNQYLTEILYTVNNGTVEDEVGEGVTEEWDVEYKKITITFGMKF